ncbi:MAG: O-antigen ligase family protein [Acidimicrobiia bacterium]|nr:O-antigen ligase family protein [Acidimicrobiia bacterium]
MVATEPLAPRQHFDPQGHRMGPLGTLASQGAVVLGVLWVFGVSSELLLPPSVGLLALFPMLGALMLAPRTVLMQLPVSFSILGIVGLPVASLIWSIDTNATFINVRSFIPSIVAIILAAGVLTLRDFTVALLWSIRIAIVVTIIALVLVPSTRYHVIGGVNDAPYPGWHGFFNHKNNMAPFLAMALPTVLVFDRNPLFKWGSLTLIGGLLVGSTSATGVSGAVFGLIAWYWLRTFQRQQDDRDSTLLFMASLVGSLAVIGGAVASFATITSAYGKDTSLSGRTDIWEASIEALSHRPLFGYGFGSLFWRVDVSPETADIWRHVRFEASHAHNGALDLALQIGLVGLFVFTALWLSTARSAWSKLDISPDLAIWVLAVLAGNFVIGLTEDVFFGGWIALFAAMKVLLMRRESSLLLPSWRDGIAKWT